MPRARLRGRLCALPAPLCLRTGRDAGLLRPGAQATKPDLREAVCLSAFDLSRAEFRMNERDDVKYSGVVKQETAGSLFLAVTDRWDPGLANWLSRACYQVGSLGRLTDSTSKSAHIHSQFLENEKCRENKMSESSASSGWSRVRLPDFNLDPTVWKL